MLETDDVFTDALRRRERGREVALATVVSTWGSSPRPPGSQLAVDETGAFVGSVSGGCVEAAVLQEASEVVRDRSARLLRFSVPDETAWGVGLACGGRVEILVEPMWPDALADALAAARRDAVPAVVATRLPDGVHALVLPDRVVADFGLDPQALARARDAAAGDRSEAIDAACGRLFLHAFVPPPRLIVVGAVHIAEPLVRMAAETGFAVTLVDPRRRFAGRDVFAGLDVAEDWPDEALVRLAPDARTAVVTLTHDPKLDDAALQAALASPAFYVGCLGSRKTQAARLGRLRRAGVDETALARLHGPVGLAIGARTPAEIAVSIIADVVRARRLGDGTAADGGVAVSTARAGR